MNNMQEAKALGLLEGITLDDLERARIPDVELPQFAGGGCCGFPHAAPDEEVADADEDVLAVKLGCDEEHARCVRQAHKTYLEHGGGSWGHCISDGYPGDDFHGVKYYVERDSFLRHGHYSREATVGELEKIVEAGVWDVSLEQLRDLFDGRPMLDVCLWLGVDETYRRVGCWHEETETKSEAGIVILSRFIPGSTIGIGWFPGAGCSSQVEFHIDSGYSAGLIKKADLFGHECGHTNNLPHTFRNQDEHRGVMSYRSFALYYGYSTGEAPHTTPRDPSLRQLIDQYTETVIPREDDPGDPPPPPPTGIIRGEHFDEATGLYVPGIHGEVYQGKAVFRGRVVVDCNAAEGEYTFLLAPAEGNRYEFESSISGK